MSARQFGRTVSEMSEDHAPDPIHELDARLKEFRDGLQPAGKTPDGDAPQSGVGVAFTIASHLVAGLIVGAGIGYLLDSWLDTSPWMLVVFFFLGAASGMLNVYRVASGLGTSMGYRPAPEKGREGVASSGEGGAKGETGENKGGKQRGQSS